MSILEHPIVKRASELHAFNVLSADDVLQCGRALHDEPNSMFWRRTAVRNFAAHVEGLVYLMRQVAIELAPVMGVKFAAGQLALLREVTFELSKKGDVEEKQKYQSFLAGFKFVCRCYAEANRSSFLLDFSDDGYRCFDAMVKIRDRLMHPKSLDDLKIADDEDKIVRNAWAWFQKQFSLLIADCTQSFTAYAQAIK